MPPNKPSLSQYNRPKKKYWPRLSKCQDNSLNWPRSKDWVSQPQNLRRRDLCSEKDVVAMGTSSLRKGAVRSDGWQGWHILWVKYGMAWGLHIHILASEGQNSSRSVIPIKCSFVKTVLVSLLADQGRVLTWAALNPTASQKQPATTSFFQKMSLAIWRILAVEALTTPTLNTSPLGYLGSLDHGIRRRHT